MILGHTSKRKSNESFVVDYGSSRSQTANILRIITPMQDKIVALFTQRCV